MWQEINHAGFQARAVRPPLSSSALRSAPFAGDLLFGCWLHPQTAGDTLLFLLPLVHCGQQWQYAMLRSTHPC